MRSIFRQTHQDWRCTFSKPNQDTHTSLYELNANIQCIDNVDSTLEKTEKNWRRKNWMNLKRHRGFFPVWFLLLHQFRLELIHLRKKIIFTALKPNVYYPRSPSCVRSHAKEFQAHLNWLNIKCIMPSNVFSVLCAWIAWNRNAKIAYVCSGCRCNSAVPHHQLFAIAW